MVDRKAFRSLSYGLYVIGAKTPYCTGGCVVNTFQQVTSSPAQVSVAINKENVTAAIVREAGRFTASCLSESAGMELIGTFGFRCSLDIDKFAACSHAFDEAGMPYLAEQASARFSARVVQEVDLGTHTLFIGEVEEAERLSDEAPMTYAYYHQVKGGKTPPKASGYEGPADASEPEPSAAESAQAPSAAVASAEAGASGTPKFAWRCKICGHIEYADELPEGFSCPLCGMGADQFERIEL